MWWEVQMKFFWREQDEGDRQTLYSKKFGLKDVFQREGEPLEAENSVTEGAQGNLTIRAYHVNQARCNVCRSSPFCLLTKSQRLFTSLPSHSKHPQFISFFQIQRKPIFMNEAEKLYSNRVP